MTGQIIIELEGRAISKVTMKGDVHARHITQSNRFIRKEWRVHKHLRYKEAQAAKPAPAPAPVQEKVEPKPITSSIPGLTEPRIVPDPSIKLTPPPIAPKPPVVDTPKTTTREDSTNGKDDKEGNAGAPKGPGRSESPQGAGR